MRPPIADRINQCVIDVNKRIGGPAKRVRIVEVIVEIPAVSPTIIDNITYGIDESGFTLEQSFTANYK